MTAVARKASKTESVCDGQAGQKTSETQAKGSKKKHLHSPRLGLAFRKFFRHKVCILLNEKGKKEPWSSPRGSRAIPYPARSTWVKTESWVVGIIKLELKIT